MMMTLALALCWPLCAAGLGSWLRLAERRYGGLLVASIVALIALTVGFRLDSQNVRAGYAWAVGPRMLLNSLLFVPCSYVAVVAPTHDDARIAHSTFGKRVGIAYLILCLSAAVAFVAWFIAAAYTCQGGCL